MTTFYQRVEGALLGCAVGDALGLPAEGMPPGAIARRFGAPLSARYRLLGRRGFVSDDTEQSALVAIALADHDPARRFRRSILLWFLALPFAVGLATLRACCAILVGLRRSGVRSAGNGAAMRAAVVGAHFYCDAAKRREVGRALAEVTHTDARAVEGALYVAEVAAGADEPLEVVANEELRAAIVNARALARRTAHPADAAAWLGTTGYVVHTVAFATFCFLRFADPREALTQAVAAGGDTDSIAAIVGAWIGARGGAQALPVELVDALHDGAFGPTRLRQIAAALDGGGSAPRLPWLRLLVGNLLLFPVVIAHGLRRLYS